MDVTMGLMAEAANTTADGRLNVLGAFTTLPFTEFPASVPRACLVVRFEVVDADWGADQWISVSVYGDTDDVLARADAHVTLPEERPASAGLAFFQQFTFTNLRLDAPGDYEVVVEVNDDPKESVIFTAAQIDE